MTFEDRYVTPTPEGVSLDVALAGLGSRFAAILLDSILQGIVFTVLFVGAIVTWNLVLTNSSGGLSAEVWLVALTILLYVLVFFGYFLVCELLWSGRTVGKRLVGTRAVRLDGSPVGFSGSLLRTISRLIDVIPVLFLIDPLVILLSPKHQRIGDLLAGTIVIRERHAADHLSRGARIQAAEWSVRVADSRWRGPEEFAGVDVTAVTADELVVVRQFLQRRWDYSPAARTRLATRLADRLRAKVRGVEETDDEKYLELVSRAKSSAG